MPPTASPRTPSRRARRSVLGALGLLTALGLVATGCSPVQPSAPDAASSSGGAEEEESTFGEAAGDDVQDGGTLTIALSAEPDRLDPTLSRSLYSRYVFSTMCEKLYDLDEDTTIVPQLATELPAVSDDGLTVTIPLRSGVVFADGTPMDAAAVVTTLQRDLTLETSARASELGPVTAVEAVDPTTVRVTLSEPFAPLTAALADRAGMIMSPAALDSLGEDFSTAPVCVGPFKFESRVPQNSIDVVRDPGYYDADRVHLDGISYRIITDASIRAANLRSGDAQVADSLSTQDVPALRSTEGVEVLESNSLGYQGITFNVGNTGGVGGPTGTIDTPVGSDPRVRQAFSMAVDREGLVQTVFGGLASPACGPVSPQSAFTSEAAQACPEHDPEAAEALLREAGAPVPYPVTLSVSNNPDSLRLAQALQAVVAEGGFELTIQPVEYSALLDAQDAGQYESTQIGWSGRVDPDANITYFVGTGGGQNYAGFSDPDLDALLTAARRSTDQDERTDLYGQAVTAVQESSPLVYLYRQKNLTGVSSDVSGVQVFPDGVLRVAFSGLAS